MNITIEKQPVRLKLPIIACRKDKNFKLIMFKGSCVFGKNDVTLVGKDILYAVSSKTNEKEIYSNFPVTEEVVEQIFKAKPKLFMTSLFELLKHKSKVTCSDTDGEENFKWSQIKGSNADGDILDIKIHKDILIEKNDSIMLTVEEAKSELPKIENLSYFSFDISNTEGLESIKVYENIKKIYKYIQVYLNKTLILMYGTNTEHPSALFVFDRTTAFLSYNSNNIYTLEERSINKTNFDMPDNILLSSITRKGLKDILTYILDGASLYVR